MGFGPLGTPCSLLLSIFPFRHEVIGRRTLKVSRLLPSGEVTAASLTCWTLEPIRWVWPMVLWCVWSIRERKKRRTSETMMWGDRITCYTSIRLWAYITRTHTKTKESLFRLYRINELLKDQKWVFFLVERERCVRLFVELFFLWCINAWKVQEEKKENKRKSKDGTNFVYFVCVWMWTLRIDWDWKIKGVAVFLNMTSLLYKRLDINFFLKTFIIYKS